MKNSMKTNPTKKRLKELAKGHKAYPTRNAALLALFKATNWDAGIYLGIYPTGDGRFYFTEDEKEALAINEELREKDIEYYAVCDDGSDKQLEKNLNTWYKKELREEYDKVVPRTCPEYEALWRANFHDLSEFANGLGGYCSPKNAVEETLQWFPKSKRIWTEAISAVVNKVLQGEEATKQIKAWTKGKTPQECAGMTDKEWLSKKITSEGALADFSTSWAYEKLGVLTFYKDGRIKKVLKVLD